MVLKWRENSNTSMNIYLLMDQMCAKENPMNNSYLYLVSYVAVIKLL